ncbi:flagellar biosynthesis protein (FlhG) [Desulfobulbus propionicus DSM 2032]|uniref:Flagellar biosynthesis protein (FlhG) n=1 Tax=Desulfobulbus propionicus (strain ATCC 33891 / DSM 2032 / VKM B-1956 / 1pr3) TaxID=577650 RepID=A0A7U4DPP9_DESPD|nr:MinD/ParA family protein [Desulfobulbus propionicus]ADW18386.1 flagellar biosynthesis protein (FlhG) [Desulfobulbus propionicus DSM 2032]
MAEHTGRPTDQAGTLRAMNSPRLTEERTRQAATRVVSVTSGKGGVGKTAVVANLAVLLARMGKRVLILDADLGLANIDVVFGLAPSHNLNHFFTGEQGLETILTDGPEGIKILPAGSGVQRFTRLDSEQKMRLLEGLDAMNNDFDFVLIDTEAGISENVTYFNTAAQEILVVTTPDPTAITDAYALMKLLSNQYHEKHFNLIVNFIRNEEEALDVYRKLTMVANRYLDISIDYIGSIPRDKLMVDAIRKQQVLVQLFPESKTSLAFEALARTIVQEPQTLEPKGSIQFFWKRLLEFGGK